MNAVWGYDATWQFGDRLVAVPPELRVFAVELVRQQITGRASAELSDVAIDAVVADAVSPSLYLLTGTDSAAQPAKATQLFEEAARELRLPLAADNGGTQFWVLLLELIIRGELGPMEGALLLDEGLRVLSTSSHKEVWFAVLVSHGRTEAHGANDHERIFAAIVDEATAILADRDFLKRALSVWDGPAPSRPEGFLSRFDFLDYGAFHAWRQQTSDVIHNLVDLGHSDRLRLLEMAETAVFDDSRGAGTDWTALQPYTIEDSVHRLSSVARRFSTPVG